MTKLGIIIAASIMFAIFSIPFVTIGAGLVALYHVMFKTLRGGGVCNPFKEFWAGFKSNFKQATILWLVFAAFAAFLSMDIQICDQAGDPVRSLRFLIYLIGAAAVFLFLYMLPCMAALNGGLVQLTRDALYFIVKKPLRFIVIAFFDIFPLVLTFTDLKFLPLYAFIWVFCGFGLIAMLGAYLLLPVFRPFLDDKDEEAMTQNPYDEEESALEDLRELDGL